MTTRSRVSMYVAPLMALVLLGQGCGSSQPATGPGGGIFRTTDGGEVWRQLRVINLGAKQASIADMGIVTLAVDAQDPKAIYAGTVENGLIYTLDNGESWLQATAPLNVGRVQAVSVDPKNKCTVYATLLNQVMKTTTCGRDWTRVYFDPRTDKSFTTLSVDWYNPSIVYAGTNDGDILKSENGGTSWRVVYRVDGARINHLVMDLRDSRVLYAATNGYGLRKSSDAGQTWQTIRKEFETFEGANRPNLVVLDPNNANRVYTVSKYGIIVSDDGGATWAAIKLPTPPGTVDMKAFAVHPKDPKKLVYVTNQAVIWSVDGGTTWTTKKLPTTRGAAAIVYPNDGTANPPLFMGASPAAK